MNTFDSMSIVVFGAQTLLEETSTEQIKNQYVKHRKRRRYEP